MKKNLKVAVNAVNALVEDVKTFVKANGGFINTMNEDGSYDNIYAYVIDWDNDDVNEEYVLAVRVKDDTLEIIPTSYKLRYSYDEEITEDTFVDDDWYPVGTGGDSVLLAQTILSIAESIEQYVD